MWGDPGQPQGPDPRVLLRAAILAITGAICAGAASISWIITGDEPKRLQPVLNSNAPLLGAALFAGAYLAWTAWRRR